MFYLYISIISLIILYIIINNIYLYKIGKYNPYIFAERTKGIKFILLILMSIGVYIGVIYFVPGIEYFRKLVYLLVFLSACLLICVCILNYLCYKKIKDHKIVLNTIIFSLIVIVLSLALWLCMKGVQLTFPKTTLRI